MLTLYDAKHIREEFHSHVCPYLPMARREEPLTYVVDSFLGEIKK